MPDATIAAVIAAVASIVAALVSAWTQHIFKQRRQDQERLLADLDTARQDIHFLLKVEERHCTLHKERDDESNKNRVRKHVRETSGLTWSGRYVPSQKPME
jgi:hypothetical protein